MPSKRRGPVFTFITKLRTELNKKIGSRKGVTLAELLCTVLVFSFASAAMVSGIRFASQKYTELMRESSARVLYSTLYSVMSNELRFTSAVELSGPASKADRPVESFYSVSYNGKTSTGFQQLDPQGDETSGFGYIAICGTSLLGKGAYTRGLLARVDELTYNTKEEFFTVTLTIGEGQEQILSQTFHVRNLNHAIQKDPAKTAGPFVLISF